MFRFDTPITALIMIGPSYAQKLKRLNIETIGDLLYHLPYRYENFSLISDISSVQPGERLTVIGTVKSIRNFYTKNGKKIQKAIVSDDTGEIEVIWYNQSFLVNFLKPGLKVSLAGMVNTFGNHYIFESPDYEISVNNRELIHSGRLVPVYPETAGLSSKWLRSRLYTILKNVPLEIEEILPDFILEKYRLPGLTESLHKIHFPKNLIQAQEARRRLAFDELLGLSMASSIRKKEWEQEQIRDRFQIGKYLPQINQFIQNLPFELTGSQKHSIREILTDLQNDKPMNRLLEGDVGAGKTVVAVAAIYAAYLNGYQTAFMTPTEILASQHFQAISKFFSGYGPAISLRTGKTGKDKSKEKLDYYDLHIGTHALISQKFKFDKLGLVIIDEQQRFGVEQRAALRQKGEHPHLLSLTATPIPRSIALTLYADLDLSVLDEMPEGRKPVKTWVVPSSKRESAYRWMREQLLDSAPSKQAFIICPFIEPSESLTTIKAAKQEYERLKKDIFPDLKLELLHGKLKSPQKEKILSDFQKGKFHILVSTPVVEVGIDIPGAVIMMIEGSDRFGLAQLHQLRGRVGRRNQQSFCLLFSDSEGEKSTARLKHLETVHNGIKLAQLDFQIRGPGDIYGTRQHGLPFAKIADISDIQLIKESKQASVLLFSLDPTLSQFPHLKKGLEKYRISGIAPD